MSFSVYTSYGLNIQNFYLGIDITQVKFTTNCFRTNLSSSSTNTGGIPANVIGFYTGA